MEIVAIYEPYLYSVQRDGQEDNEFARLFDEWNDLGKVLPFLEASSRYLESPSWRRVPEPEDAAKQVLEEARALEELFGELCENTRAGVKPDFDTHFRFLGGSRYGCVLEYVPVKSYGPLRPSLLRVYAVKVASNVYVITGGGIKLARSIQESPGISESTFRGIDETRAWLKGNGVIDADDL